MTRPQIVLAVLLCLLTAGATDLLLLLFLAEAGQPGWNPPYAIPACTVGAIALFTAFAFSIRRYAKVLSVPAAAAFTFVGCIPIYLVMEVTVM